MGLALHRKQNKLEGVQSVPKKLQNKTQSTQTLAESEAKKPQLQGQSLRKQRRYKNQCRMTFGEYLPV